MKKRVFYLLAVVLTTFATFVPSVSASWVWSNDPGLPEELKRK